MWWWKGEWVSAAIGLECCGMYSHRQVMPNKGLKGERHFFCATNNKCTHSIFLSIPKDPIWMRCFMNGGENVKTDSQSSPFHAYMYVCVNEEKSWSPSETNPFPSNRALHIHAQLIGTNKRKRRSNGWKNMTHCDASTLTLTNTPKNTPSNSIPYQERFIFLLNTSL